MAKSRNRRKSGFFGDNYWQSSDWNQRAFQSYLIWLESMYVNRFRWVGLPETCDERYLEWTLLTQGVCSIAHPKSMPDTFFTTKANLNGRWNVYDTPSRWESIGNNGWRFQASPKSGVLIFDNRLRMPKYQQIEFFARRLANLDRIEDINLSHQRTPYLITAPRPMANDAKQIYKQIQGGEPAIIARPEISNIEISAISTQVPYLGKELSDKKLALWDEIYAFMGISHVGQKSERLTSEEVSASNEPANLMALDGLNARREAMETFNRRFGWDVQVVWNKDNESDMYNFIRNPLVNEEAQISHE